MKDVKLPEIGEGVTEGELVKWLVKKGDEVSEDQPVAEMMTDKATVEVPSPVGGVVQELKFKEGDVIPVETVILTLEGGKSSKKTKAAPTKTPAKAPTKAGPSPFVQSATPATSAPAGNGVLPPADPSVLATPSTRRLAREMNVNLNTLQGTGLAGRVTREDVLSSQGGTPSFTPNTNFVAGGEEKVPLKGIRRKIFQSMQLAKQTIPHFTLMDEVCVDELVALRSKAKTVAAQQGVKLTYLPFIMKILFHTLKDFPMFNATIDEKEVTYKRYYNMGFAADTPDGLLVPVIKHVDQKSVLQLGSEIVALADKAKQGKLQLEDMKGATITVTNIGSIGGNYATPIINPPEVAIIGLYKIHEKVIVRDGEPVVANMMNLTVTADHRLIDGAVAARFLKAFMERLENPVPVQKILQDL